MIALLALAAGLLSGGVIGFVIGCRASARSVSLVCPGDHQHDHPAG